MNASWKSLCHQSGLEFHGNCIRVKCGAERFQEIQVDDSDPKVIRLWSRVALRSQLPDDRGQFKPEVEAWLINRFRELVGFKVAERGTVIGENWIPTFDITAQEWRVYVHTLATACDRLEYLWTGADRE